LLSHNFNQGPVALEQLNNTQANLFLNQQFLNANLAGSVGQMSPAQIYQYHLLATSTAKMQQNQHLHNDQASKMLDWILKSSSQQHQKGISNSTQFNNLLLGPYHEFLTRQHQSTSSLRFQAPSSFQEPAKNSPSSRRKPLKKSFKVIPVETILPTKRKLEISPVVSKIILTSPKTPNEDLQTNAKKLKPLPEAALLQKQEHLELEDSTLTNDETNNNNNVSNSTLSTSVSSSTAKSKSYPCPQCGKVNLIPIIIFINF